MWVLFPLFIIAALLDDSWGSKPSFFERLCGYILLIFVTIVFGLGLWKMGEGIIWLFKNVKISIGV